MSNTTAVFFYIEVAVSGVGSVRGKHLLNSFTENAFWTDVELM